MNRCLKFKMYLILNVITASSGGYAHTCRGEMSPTPVAVDCTSPRPIAPAERVRMQPAIQSPLDVLLAKYRASKVLAIGESNHSRFSAYEMLEALLRKVGRDPQLTALGVEYSWIFRDYFLAASTSETQEPPGLNQNLFYDYYRLRFWPLIREINAQRDPKNPLIVVPLDGAPVQGQFGHADSQEHRSWDRENQTRLHFTQEILPRLKAGQKAIVFYHLFHLVQGLSARLPVVYADRPATLGPANWLGQLIEAQPALRAQIRVVAIDERDSSWAPHGTFTLTQSLGATLASRPFGIDVARLSSLGLPSARGLANFCVNSSFDDNFEDEASDASLDQIVDGLISIPADPSKDYRTLIN